MEKISKLEIIGEGEKEIVYFDDMQYEQTASTLKVYITKQNQDKLLPLNTTSLTQSEEKKEIEFIQLPIESKRLLFKALDLPTEGNICHYCKQPVEFSKVSLMPAYDGSVGWVLCDSPLCICEYLEEESKNAKHTEN